MRLCRSLAVHVAPLNARYRASCHHACHPFAKSPGIGCDPQTCVDTGYGSDLEVRIRGARSLQMWRFGAVDPGNSSGPCTSTSVRLRSYDVCANPRAIRLPWHERTGGIANLRAFPSTACGPTGVHIQGPNGDRPSSYMSKGTEESYLAPIALKLIALSPGFDMRASLWAPFFYLP